MGQLGITPCPKNSLELFQSGLLLSLAAQSRPQYWSRILVIVVAPACISLASVPSASQRCRRVRKLLALP
jgi:hypothetical protein